MKARIFVREDGSYGFDETSVLDKDSFEVNEGQWAAYQGLLVAVAYAERGLLTKAASQGAHPLNTHEGLPWPEDED